MAENADAENLITSRNNLITYILNNCTSKYPLKANEMADMLPGSEQKKSKVLSQVLPEVTDALKKTYGIILKQVPNSSSGRKYICFAENRIIVPDQLDEDQKRQITLLFIILSFIFMSGGKAYESKVEQFLEGLNIFYTTDHPYFGSNLKKLIGETFVRQLYLKKEKSDSEFDVDTKYVLSWGYRSYAEFTKMRVLEMVAKIMDREAAFFESQLNQAKKDDIATEDTVNIE